MHDFFIKFSWRRPSRTLVHHLGPCIRIATRRTCCINGSLDAARTKCECREQAPTPSPTAQRSRSTLELKMTEEGNTRTASNTILPTRTCPMTL